MSGSAPTVAVVGAGAWGTTLAAIVAKREPVVLVTHRPELADEINRSHRNERRLPGIDLPEALVASADTELLRGATELVIFAVPSSHLRSVAGEAGPLMPPTADVLSTGHVKLSSRKHALGARSSAGCPHPLWTG